MPHNRVPRLIIAVLLLAASLTAQQSIAIDRPNFLLIVADDLTWSDLGYEGNATVRTPHLDKLCTESLHLTRMFTPASMCSPARHALYTGLFPVRSGAYPNHTRVHDGTRTVFGLLKDAGYRVALQAKSHVGPKSSFPYEGLGAADNFAATKKFITRDNAEPWMLAYCSNHPHSPWTAGPRSVYEPDEIIVPPYLHDCDQTRKALCNYYAEVTALDNQVGSLLELLDATGQENNTLVMFVSEQGSSFPNGGKWNLYDTGIRVSTLIRWPGVTKPGTKCDALVQYVDVAPTFLEAAEIDPEKIDTGCPDANGNRRFDGRSFMTLLNGQQQALRDYVFAEQTTVGVNGYQRPFPMRAVRDTRYKYIRNLAPENEYDFKGVHRNELFATWKERAENDEQLRKLVRHISFRPAEELFDLESDPLERKNLADDPEYSTVKETLSRQLDRWMQQQGDQGMPTELNARSRQPRSSKKKPKVK